MNPGLSALVVHDLKNRLAAHAQHLAEVHDAHPAIEAALRPLRDDVDALQRRLIAFLTLYRADAGGLSTDEQEEDPARLAAQLARVAATLGTRRGLRVELDAARAPASWFLDAYLVGLALEAAIDNAVRFAATGVRVVAEARRVDGADALVLAVEDDGPGPGGMPADEADASASTGLGHALGRMVARLHRVDGRAGEVALIDLGATGAARGARFEMRLP
mgnify:CR=1 FL=1